MPELDVGSERHRELRSTQVEPLLPVEKKLVGWSLAIGLALLALLAAVNHFIPASI